MFQRKYLGQNGANISFVTQAIKIQQNVATVIASQLFVFSRIVPHHYQPRCHATITGAQITHLFSEELRFVVGTHLSIETSWPPALPAHHWITMVSLRGKNRSRSSCRDSAHRHHRWDKAVAKRREGVFWAVPLSRRLSLSLLLPPGAACASLTSLAGCWRETAALVFAWKESPC